MLNNSAKLLVIVGPTSSGKTSLSIELAKKFNGEIISADSRQVYKGMDIGSGKVTKKEMQGVKHYLLDVASPKSQFSAARFEKMGTKAIKEILKKGKLPIICGGTGFWVDALIYGLPEGVAPDWKLRRRLGKLSNQVLLNKLRRVWGERAATIDPQNKRRLIRALELAMKGLKPLPQLNRVVKYDVLKLGVLRSKLELKKRIHDRLLARMKIGMVKEVERLHEQGVSWRKLDDFGLEYRFISRYLRGIIPDKENMLFQLETAINHYAKRQNTWFKRDREIIWVKDQQIAIKKAKKWCFDK